MTVKPMTILLAEDDEGHALLVTRNLRRAGFANEIVHVSDGQAALDFVHRSGAYSNRCDDGSLLLLLDINMPCLDGVQVLQTIKSDETTAKVPVIMLTTTDDPREINRCYGLGCSVYITKPVEYDEFIDAIKRLGLFLQIVQLPPEKKNI